MTIEKKYLVEKRNTLNEIRSNNMSLQELRFFSIYLAKINSRDPSTRVVRFLLSDFQKIMDMSALKITQLQSTTDRLLQKLVMLYDEEPEEKEEYFPFVKFQLFKECTVAKDDNGEWYIEIDAHDKALPLMFEFKEKYFTYELWNALHLKSANQLRMYEILKQYEKLGERTLSLVDLKALLGIYKGEYTRYDSLKSNVLDVCQEALGKYTDIKFAYEAIRAKGKSGKTTAIKFTIMKNKNHVDPLSLDDFIDIADAKAKKDENGNKIIETTFEDESKETKKEIKFESAQLEFIAGACNDEFNEAQIRVLYNLLIQIIPSDLKGTTQDYQMKIYDYLKHVFDILNLRASTAKIKNRFAYLKKLLEIDIANLSDEK